MLSHFRFFWRGVVISWFQTVSVLKEFELSRVPLFSFSEDQFAEEEDRRTTFQYPPELEAAAQRVQSSQAPQPTPCLHS